MKKPHEEQWTHRDTNTGPVIYRDDGDAVAMVYYPREGMTLEESDSTGEARARLIAAAPDMARSLALAEELVNAIQQGHRVDEQFLERAHASINGARRKAGVL